MLEMLISAAFLFSGFGSCGCKCLPVDDSETTYEGGNMVEAYVEERKYRHLNGKVVDSNGIPLSEVLVEVFDNPEWIKQKSLRTRGDQKRIAVCKTASDGVFCFKDIPKGKYELRLSKGRSWNPTHIYIEVEPKGSDAVSDPLEVWLTVGV